MQGRVQAVADRQSGRSGRMTRGVIVARHEDRLIDVDVARHRRHRKRREADAQLVDLERRVGADVAVAVGVGHDGRIHQRIGREAGIRGQRHAGNLHGVTAAVDPVAVRVPHEGDQVQGPVADRRDGPWPLTIDVGHTSSRSLALVDRSAGLAAVPLGIDGLSEARGRGRRARAQGRCGAGRILVEGAIGRDIRRRDGRQQAVGPEQSECHSWGW